MCVCDEDPLEIPLGVPECFCRPEHRQINRLHVPCTNPQSPPRMEMNQPEPSHPMPFGLRPHIQQKDCRAQSSQSTCLSVQNRQGSTVYQPAIKARWLVILPASLMHHCVSNSAKFQNQELVFQVQVDAHMNMTRHEIDAE